MEDVYLDTRFRGCPSDTGFTLITMIVIGKLRTHSSLIAANKRTAFKFIFIPVLKTDMGVNANR